ncbi:MAG: glycosyltransferase family 2 protein [Chitinophagales bacterium]
MNWSIIVFAYNEEGALAKTVNQAAEFLTKNAGDWEIILVDDGSTDKTPAIAGVLQQQISTLKVIRHQLNKGIGEALRSGYLTAQYDYVCAVPGDGQFDIWELEKVEPFAYTMFYSFYRPQPDYNFYRTILHRSNRFFNRIFLGITLHDVNWIKVYRKEQLSFTGIELHSSLVESELAAKLLKAGAQVKQLPSVYMSRMAGTPKGGSLKTVLQAISETLNLIGVVRRFKGRLGK